MFQKNMSISPNKKPEGAGRLSGIELLRIIAIFLICLCHAIGPTKPYLDYYSVLSAENVILKVIGTSGQIGNILFVICSSYFLLDSKRTKFEKVINILLDSMCISICFLVGFLTAGYKLTTTEIISQILPDVFQNLWFIPVYAVLYAIHPLLNGAINSLTQKGHLIVCIVIFVTCSFSKLLFNATLTNNEPILNFIVLYFIIAYIKKYCNDFAFDRKKNIIFFLIFSALFLVMATIKGIFETKIDYFRSSFVVDSFCSPFLVPPLLCLFNIFHSLKFRNRAVNYLASCSLFVYCFHHNILLRTITIPDVYAYLMNNWFNLSFLWVIVGALVLFFGAYVLAVIYKETVHRLTIIISRKTGKLFDAACDAIYKSVTKAKSTDDDSGNTDVKGD